MTTEVAKKITFTEILYSVVIATALTRLTFEISLHNGMLLFGVLIILSDYVEYHVSLAITEETLPTVRVFLGDITLLLVWNTLVIIPGHLFEWYVVFLIVFFITQQCWELLAGRYSIQPLLFTPTSGLILAYTAILVPVTFGLVSDHAALMVCVFLFVLAKLPAWSNAVKFEDQISL